MLEKKVLYWFYGFWVFVGLFGLVLHGVSVYTAVHLGVLWGVSYLGLYCAKYRYDVGYVCLGIMLVYIYWQIKYFDMQAIMYLYAL